MDLDFQISWTSLKCMYVYYMLDTISNISAMLTSVAQVAQVAQCLAATLSVSLTHGCHLQHVAISSIEANSSKESIAKCSQGLLAEDNVYGRFAIARNAKLYCWFI